MSSIPDVKPSLETLKNEEEVKEHQRIFKVMSSELTAMGKKSNRAMERLKEENHLLKSKIEFDMSLTKMVEAELKKIISENEGLKGKNSCLDSEKGVISKRLANAEGRENVLLEKLKKAQEWCVELENEKRKLDGEVELLKVKVSENEGLKVKISFLDDDKTVISKRLANAEGREKVSLDKLKKTQEQCVELENEKRKLDGELELLKERFAELQARMMTLGEGVLSLAIGAGLNVDDDDLSDLPNAATIPPPQNVIEIIDSDDDCPANNTSSGKDGTPKRSADKLQSSGARGEGGKRVLKRKLGSCTKTTVAGK